MKIPLKKLFMKFCIPWDQTLNMGYVSYRQHFFPTLTSESLSLSLSLTIVVYLIRTNNPVLLHLAFRLCSFLEQLRVRKLITSMISTSPDILMPFLKGVSLDLEPKLSQKWMWNMELILSVSF